MNDRNAPAILHLDLDAFFASVEQLRDPSLLGRPVIVGGLGNRGVVAAASYEARAFGVHSAMPMVRARRACPNGVFVAPTFAAYSDASRAVMAILRSVTPLVEPLSLDEAFLDVSGASRTFGTSSEIAVHLRSQVKAETGLTASVGVATTKMLAKIASDLAKPDGIYFVSPDTEIELLHSLAVNKLWGVGPATRVRLAGFGVETIGDLAALPEATLIGALGEASGRHLHVLSWNRDYRSVEPNQELRSIGHEETFSVDRTDADGLESDLGKMADRIAAKLRSGDRTARTVTLKIRFDDFVTITRSQTLLGPTDLTIEIAETARNLFRVIDLGRGIRLMGISVTGLQEGAPVQGVLGLTDSSVGDREQHRAIDTAVDSVRERFGDGAIGAVAGRTRSRENLWGPDAPGSDSREESVREESGA